MHKLTIRNFVMVIERLVIAICMTSPRVLTAKYHAAYSAVANSWPLAGPAADVAKRALTNFTTKVEEHPRSSDHLGPTALD